MFLILLLIKGVYKKKKKNVLNFAFPEVHELLETLAHKIIQFWSDGEMKILKCSVLVEP